MNKPIRLLVAALLLAGVMLATWWWAFNAAVVVVPQGQSGTSAGVAFRLDTLQVVQSLPGSTLENEDAYEIVTAQFSYQGASTKLVACIVTLVSDDFTWKALGDPDSDNDIPNGCGASAGKFEVLFVVPVNAVDTIRGVQVDVWQEPLDSRVLGLDLISPCKKAEACDARDGVRHADLLLSYHLD
ncbi:MAG: hypothetical protein LBC29_07345 [Propionibacteriaceae bacterium]|nr:hypothetical protein [Propionibacteriaceae bacterium]